MTQTKSLKWTQYALLFILYAACVKPYNPPAIQAANNYLVVDGIINTGGNAITTIILSRSKNLADTVSFIPELNAQVSIVDSTGATFPLVASNSSGKYLSSALNLNQIDKYKILITTSNGHQYQSAFVRPETTPAIDSLSWLQSPVNNGVTINVITHDPANNTHYYRWDFLETWQHNSPEIAQWVLINGIVTALGADYLNDPRQIHKCWTTIPSSHIVVGTSLNLSQDVISLQPVNFIPFNDVRLTVRYSILVNQYALSGDAYNYWLLIQNNSQNLGGLFDLIPSQLNSNIQCITNPNEPVIGYISASTIQQQRIFITNSQVSGWDTIEPYNECSPKTIPTDTSNFAIYNYPDTSYAPWYFTGDFIPALIIIKKYCVDCRTQGGTTSKPSFW